MNILVTGAGSKAGVEMARRLQAAGAHVRTTTHLPSHAVGGAMGAGVAVDFRRPESLGPAFAGIDKAVLITPEESTMVSMTENLIVAARRAQVSHVVLVSFLHADSRAGGTLLGWHRRAEEVVMASGVLSTCLRPNYYMQNFLSAYAPAASLGGGKVSYIDAADVAEVAARVLLGEGHGGMTYSLTGPRALSMKEVAALLLGEASPSVGAAAKGWEETCLLGRRSAQSAHMQALCEFWDAANDDRFADITPTFERLTGRPPTSFERFVQKHRGELQALRRAHGAPAA